MDNFDETDSDKAKLTKLGIFIDPDNPDYNYSLQLFLQGRVPSEYRNKFSILLIFYSWVEKCRDQWYDPGERLDSVSR
jgi:hypothetical protein